MIIPPSKIALQDDFIRVDGFAAFKVFVVDGTILLEFYDRDRLRSSCRQDHLLRVDMTDLVQRIQQLLDEQNKTLVK